MKPNELRGRVPLSSSGGEGWGEEALYSQPSVRWQTPIWLVIAFYEPPALVLVLRPSSSKIRENRGRGQVDSVKVHGPNARLKNVHASRKQNVEFSGTYYE